MASRPTPPPACTLSCRPRPPTLPPRQPSEIPGETERSALKPETRPPNGASGCGQHRSAGGKVTRGSPGGGRSSRQGRGAFEVSEDALAAGAAEHSSCVRTLLPTRPPGKQVGEDALAAPRAGFPSLSVVTRRATSRAGAEACWWRLGVGVGVLGRDAESLVPSSPKGDQGREGRGSGRWSGPRSSPAREDSAVTPTPRHPPDPRAG